MATVTALEVSGAAMIKPSFALSELRSGKRVAWRRAASVGNFGEPMEGEGMILGTEV